MATIVDRFIAYCRFDTRSDDANPGCPSTPGQLVFAEYLVRELQACGLTGAALDGNGYVMATLPGNLDRPVPAMGFIAHLDTSPEISGANVRPRIIPNYDGQPLVLDDAANIVLSPSDCPELDRYVGETLITTDGKTLLGADDKAGIAAIVTALEYLTRHPEIKHGPVRVAFTPDEEIGRGADRFDIAGFNVAFAYTVDGGGPGELEYETFNAAEAQVKIKGRNVHPGQAKNRMRNSLHIAFELNALLPPAEVPARTEGYEGFYHLTKLAGDVEETVLTYILRDHAAAGFAARKDRLKKAVAYLNDQYGPGTVNLVLRDQYYNMREKIEPVLTIVDLARQAMDEAGLVPKIQPVRGGTDGAQLSYRGLPCPNIFAGGHNAHDRREFLAVSSLEKASIVIRKIIEIVGREPDKFLVGEKWLFGERLSSRGK